VTGVEKTDAYLVREQGKLLVHIGRLTLEVVLNDDEAGPLGWKGGQDSGVTFWESAYVSKSEDFFEHGIQHPLVSKKMTEQEVQELVDALTAEADLE
jgi:hypothetical protein